MHTFRRLAPVLGALLLALGGLSACGGGDEDQSQDQDRERTGQATVTVTVEDSADDTETLATTEEGDDALVDRPADFPNGGEAFLLARLAPGVDELRCTREPADALTDGAIAGIWCDLGDTDGVQVYYDLFRNARAMQRAYASIRSSQGLSPNQGPCEGAARTGEGPWTWDPTGENGRIACFRKNNRLWYMWAQPSQRAIGFARGTDAAAVESYWLALGLLRDNADEDLPATGRAATQGAGG